MPDTTNQLLEQLADFVRHRYFGKYRGIVTDTADPAERGRIQVKVPAILGDLTTWAMPCVPYAGEGVGSYFIPKKDSGVWVEFEGGDPSFPIWSGCFWAQGELPDESNEDIKIIKTEKTTFRIDDANDEIVLQVSSGSTITIIDDITAESGGAELIVGSDGVISTKGSSTIKVGSSKIEAKHGPTTSEHAPSGFAVNGGAFKVLP